MACGSAGASPSRSNCSMSADSCGSAIALFLESSSALLKCRSQKMAWRLRKSAYLKRISHRFAARESHRFGGGFRTAIDSCAATVSLNHGEFGPTVFRDCQAYCNGRPRDVRLCLCCLPRRSGVCWPRCTAFSTCGRFSIRSCCRRLWRCTELHCSIVFAAMVGCGGRS